MLVRALTATAVLVLALAGCSGNGCEELPGLTAERDAARAAYARLVASGTATTAETEEGDARTHAFDRRVYDLQQACSSSR